MVPLWRERFAPADPMPGLALQVLWCFAVAGVFDIFPDRHELTIHKVMDHITTVWIVSAVFDDLAQASILLDAHASAIAAACLPIAFPIHIRMLPPTL